MTDTYTYPCECWNCNHKFDATIPKGSPVEGRHECPNCGCKTGQPVRKASPVAPILPLPWREPQPHSPRPVPFRDSWIVWTNDGHSKSLDARIHHWQVTC